MLVFSPVDLNFPDPEKIAFASRPEAVEFKAPVIATAPIIDAQTRIATLLSPAPLLTLPEQGAPGERSPADIVLVDPKTAGWILHPSVWRALDRMPVRLDFARNDNESYLGMKLCVPFGEHPRR